MNRRLTWSLVAIAAVTLGRGERCRAQAAGESLETLQRRVVARLTGWSSDGGQAASFARSTPEERATAAAYLAEELGALGLDPVRQRYRLRNVNGLVDVLLPPYRGVNVYAEIPATAGADAERVIVGAHYDSERGSPGAIDNASGVAVLLAAAREIATVTPRARTFVFVLLDQEEDDEVGSRAFVRHVRARGWDVHSVHVVDLAGWDPDGDRTVELQSPAPHLVPVYREVAEALSIPIVTVGGASSDNKSFMAAGLPSIGVFQDEYHPGLHRPGDTFDTVDFGYLASMTRLVTAVLRRLASP